MNDIRTFVGIDFDRELKEGIYELQQRLKQYAVKGRWKHIDNFHLTLKFLGEIHPFQKVQIDDAIRNVCIGRKPFQLEVSKIGMFNGRNSIRVLWLGLGGDIQELHTLQKEIDRALASIGFPPEQRRFRPHITIGQDIVFERDFDRIQDEIGKPDFNLVKVDRLFLFKSEQIRNKRVYTKVSEYEFYDMDVVR
ncbi:MAG: RNA 2',3'-cyclic phosphodiesterase [Clostridia bacterium]